MADLRSSAAYRIAFVYSAAFALAIILLAAAVYFVADAEFRQQRDAGIAEESTELVRTLWTEGWQELSETIVTREAGGAGRTYGYAVFDRTGRRIAGSLDTRRPQGGWSDIVFRDPNEGPDPARALSRLLPDGRLLVVAVDSEPLERIDRTILILFGVAFVAILVLGGAGALILGGYLRRRLARISGTAQAIVGGDLDLRMPVGPRGDEFDALAGSLNAMLDRIAQLMENLQQVSSDVAHDLRTPLTRLRTSLETALARPADPAPLEDAVRQSDALLSLFAAILRISEVAGCGIGRSFLPVDVAMLAQDVGETYVPAIADGGRALDCRIARDLWIIGDRELIAQSLINLLDNAQVHTPIGSNIVLCVEPAGDHIRLSVSDDGPGVPAADRERIARRFVRLADSRTTPGNGLGLNLVAAIAAAHGGAMQIADNRPGLSVSLLLPRHGR